jgi:hypothetical protein
MKYSSLNLSDGIKAVLGYGGLNLSPEDTRTYEKIFWKALSEGAFTIGEALDEIFGQLDVPDEVRGRLKQAFEVTVTLRQMPRITILG